VPFIPDLIFIAEHAFGRIARHLADVLAKIVNGQIDNLLLWAYIAASGLKAAA
jgi:hypothetical protein